MTNVLRTSVLVETEQTRILLDCGPDFRQQILPLDFRRIDAVLLTHEHYDHVGGIDDLRPFGVFGDVQLYASERTGGQLRQSLPYCFVEHKYPGVPSSGFMPSVRTKRSGWGNCRSLP